VILFVYRDEVYTKETCTKPGIAEIIVAKNRSGEMGTAETRWVGKHQAFDPVTASPPDAGRWAGSAPDDDDRMYR
jgi:replicative DNA helicase